MNIFELNGLNIVSVDNIIGCYDDVKDKSKNIFDKKKKFRKFKMTLHVLPQDIKHIECKIPNYDIFGYYKKCKEKDKDTCWDITEKIEDGKIMYIVYDKTPMKITDVFIELDDYYIYYDGVKVIKNIIKSDNGKPIQFGVEYKEPMFNQLTTYLNRKYDDHILWQET